MTLIILLFGAAIVLLVAEAMFPSFGMLGLMAAVAFLFSILEAFKHGDIAGYSTVGAALVAAPGAFVGGLWLLRHSAFGRRITLEGPSAESVSGKAIPAGLDELKGCRGIVLTPLRPAGSIDIGGRRIDAISDGDFIEKNTAVRVVTVEGNRIVVAKDAPDA